MDKNSITKRWSRQKAMAYHPSNFGRQVQVIWTPADAAQAALDAQTAEAVRLGNVIDIATREVIA